MAQSHTERNAAKGEAAAKASRSAAITLNNIDQKFENHIRRLPKDWKRKRKKYFADPILFLQEIFPHIFSSPFGDAQREAILAEVEILENGGTLIKSCFRGFGKSMSTLCLILFAILKGKQKFGVQFGSSLEKSMQLGSLIIDELTDNEKLHRYFPETYCFSLAEGHSLRAVNQNYSYRNDYKNTGLVIKKDLLCFPELPKKFLGFVPGCAKGIFAIRPVSNVRGLNIRGQRPTAVVMDDCATDADAFSLSSTNRLLHLFHNQIAPLGGRGKKISIVCNGTPIMAGDFHCQMMDSNYTAKTFPLVYSMPVNRDLWQTYLDTRGDFVKADPISKKNAHAAATKFYHNNRIAMDEGVRVAWDHAYDPDIQLSTIQAVYDFIQDHGELAHEAENQCAPRDPLAEKALITVDQVKERQGDHEEFEPPQATELITAFIDVGKDVLWFAVVAWQKNFTGHVLQFGTYPEQGRILFSKTNLFRKLSDVYPHREHTGWLKAGLKDLIKEMLEANFTRANDLVEMPIDCIGIDVGYESELVKAVIQSFKSHNRKIIPVKGYGSSKTKKPLAQVSIKNGDQRGSGYIYRRPERVGDLRLMESDTNFNKSFLIQRMLTEIESAGALSFFRGDEEGKYLELMGEHCTAEIPTPTETANGDFDIWNAIPNRDNDLFDVLTGNVCLASFSGCEFEGNKTAKRKVKKFDKKKYLAKIENL